MAASDFLSWLTRWLSQHPLKAPSKPLGASYIEEVMGQIKAAEAATPVPAWRPKPQLAFALGTALACGLILLVAIRQPANRLIQQVEHEWQLLSELGVESELPAEGLDEDLRLLDQLMLAEAGAAVDEEGWIEQTLELLEQLESENPNPASSQETPPEGTDLLEELQWLDETELASS